MESNIENSFVTKYYQRLIVKLVLMLVIDLLFSLLVVTLFVSRETLLGNYLPVVSLVPVCLFPCIIMFVRRGQINQIILYGLLSALLVLGIFIFSVSWWLFSIILLYLHWRFVTHFQGDEIHIDLNSGVVLAFIFFSAVSLIFNLVNDLGNETVIYFLLLTLLSSIALGTAIQRLMSDSSSQSGMYKQLLKPIVILLGVIFTAGVLSFIIPFVRTGFYWVVEKVFWVISFLVDPIYHLLLKLKDWVMSLISSDTLEGMGMKLDKTDLKSIQQNAFYEGITIPWLKVVLIGVFLITVISYLLKKRQITLETNDVEDSISPLTTFTSNHNEERKQPIKADYSDAGNTIRKSMKTLEIEASTINLGRNFNENVRSWFMRMRIIEEEEFFSLYEKVRYGMKDPSQDEVDYFTSQIKVHIAKLKDRKDY